MTAVLFYLTAPFTGVALKSTPNAAISSIRYEMDPKPMEYLSMTKKWSILFCDPFVKLCPASDFLDSCSSEHQVKVLHFLELLEEMGPTLPRPYADLLEDGIHELRVSLSGDHVRVLYFFCFETYIVVYRAFRKHSSKVPSEYIRETRQYREMFLSRVDRDSLEKYSHEDLQDLSSGQVR
jgi:hypothetical protein